jgi:hypothetical protein
MIAPPGGSDLRDALGLHLGRFPEGAPLRGVIASDAVQDLLARFDKADATAIGEQRTYRRFCRSTPGSWDGRGWSSKGCRQSR